MAGGGLEGETARIIIMNHHQSRHANSKQRDSRMERLRRCEKVNVLSGSRCLVSPLNVTNCRVAGPQRGQLEGLHAHYPGDSKFFPYMAVNIFHSFRCGVGGRRQVSWDRRVHLRRSHVKSFYPDLEKLGRATEKLKNLKKEPEKLLISSLAFC